ncbi:hypothetical protein Tco_1543965, partial [Tanacetum coccineum]
LMKIIGLLYEESLGEDASKHGRMDAIDADEEITLVSVHDVNVSAGEKVFVADATTTVSTATTITATIKTVDDITLAQALEEMKTTKPKKKVVVIQELALKEMKTTKPEKKGIVIQELGESTTIISSQLSSQQLQEKGKGILIEPVKPMKKKF